jgi:hypothetical protein
MGILLNAIKYILVMSFVALVAVTLSVGFAVGALVFIVLGRLLGRKPATFRVYTTGNFRRDNFEQPPMKDVTPKQPGYLPNPEA